MAATSRQQASGREEVGEAHLSLLDAVLEGQGKAIAMVSRARSDILRAAGLMAEALRDGGRVIYVGVGASGAVAFQDFAELPGTFGISLRQIAFISPDAPGEPYLGAEEDDRDAGGRAVLRLKLTSSDLIVALAASGTTPYTLGAALCGKSCGARLVAIVCRPGSPLQDSADVTILADTGEEAVLGSTRLAAASAQKAALGAMSTVAASMLGHVYRGRMVNMRASNAKLRERAIGIVADFASVPRERAEQALQATDADVKAAVLWALGEAKPGALIAAAGGDLGLALARLEAARHQRGPEARI